MQKAQQFIWVIPGILLGLSSLTAVTMFGVFLAWKRESNRRYQRLLSWFVLPFFLAFSLTIWVTAIAAALTTAAGIDACTNGSANGTPSQTVQSLLVAQNVEPQSMVFEVLTSYTTGCGEGTDPTHSLASLQNDIQTVVDAIWFHYSDIDSSGRATLVNQCGDTGEIENFLTGARDLAVSLKSVRNAIYSAASSLDCNEIHPIYVSAVDESICTDITTASALGFLIFFAIGVTTMCMITLRASWRHKIDDDKIYDESEVAENMIVDEHEEYLAYISKYKHEWQEYKGIDNDNVQSEPEQNASVEESGGPTDDSASESQNTTGTRSDPGITDDEVPPAPIEEPVSDGDTLFEDGVDVSSLNQEEPPEEAFAPFARSIGTRSPAPSLSGDISFPSLQCPHTPRSVASSDAGDSLILPPPLLQWSHQADSESVNGIPPPMLPQLSSFDDNTRSDISSLQDVPTREESSIEVPTSPNLVGRLKNFLSSSPRRRSRKQQENQSQPPTPESTHSGNRSVSSLKDSIGGTKIGGVLLDHFSSSSTTTSDGFCHDEHDQDLPINNLGTPVPLQSPPKKRFAFWSSKHPSSNGEVKFQVSEEEVEQSEVQRKVDMFSRKPKPNLPLTPPKRITPGKVQGIANKFAQPATGPRGDNV